jgi:outer membrane protein assembly factor BamC
MRLKLGSIAVYLISASSIIVSGCSSDGDERRQEYLDADYYSRLELPPDLTAPSTRQALSVPKPTDAALEKFRTETEYLGKVTDEGEPDVTAANTGVTPVVKPKLRGAALKSDAGLYWLEVDSDAQKLWPQLSAFWSHEGVRIVQNKPALGLVETDWVNKLQVDEDASWLERTFGNLEPDKLDKFRMRIEPVEGADKTRIFVTHSGMEVQVQGDDVNWRTRCSEEELEHEILNRLALFVGLDSEQAKTALANYKPYASRVKIPQDEASILYVTGTMDFVWKRTLRALDRLGTDVQEMDSNTHQVKLGIAQLSEPKGDEERDELAESSWLMQWIRGDASADNEDRQFTLDLEQKNGVIKLSILDRDGELAETVLAEQLRKGLAIELQ